MDMCRAPSVVMVAPRIFSGADRDEAIAPLGIGQRPPGARKIRIERRVVLVGAMRVASGGIRLPDLDERMRGGFSVLVEHASADDDALADRLALVLARQVVIARLEVVVAEDRAGQLRERLRRDDERLSRVPLCGRRVRLIVVIGLRTGVRPAIAAQLAHASFPFSTSGAPVMRCSSASSRPSTISITVRPRSVTSMTARSV